ncbi:hypothetical protein BH09GEM1_BH09GEM1_12680 [soil metagenome]
MDAEQPPTRKPDDARASGSRRQATLLALGSATVLSVYSAGFMRTRAAASRIESAASMRRAPASSAAAPLDTASRERAVAPIPSDTPSRTSDITRYVVAAKPPKGVSAAPLQVATNTPPPLDPPAPAPAAIPSAPAPPAPVHVDTVPTPPRDTAHAGWKDGTYVGWGTSRHGDIEATVEIKGGRIISASISDCRTRYPCSRIDQLPPQVLTRQSPEVDYVSGATQSSDAYYYAVTEALKKAK